MVLNNSKGSEKEKKYVFFKMKNGYKGQRMVCILGFFFWNTKKRLYPRFFRNQKQNKKRLILILSSFFLFFFPILSFYILLQIYFQVKKPKKKEGKGDLPESDLGVAPTTVHGGAKAVR